MLVSSFNLSQSFNYTSYLFYKKRFKSEINSFYIWTLVNSLGGGGRGGVEIRTIAINHAVKDFGQVSCVCNSAKLSPI